MAQQNSTEKPVHEIRLGRVRAATWENETQHGVRHNVTVSRLYRDGNNWKDSSSFDRDELPLVGKVLDRCHDWMFSYQVAGSSNGNGSSTEDDSF